MTHTQSCYCNCELAHNLHALANFCAKHKVFCHVVPSLHVCLEAIQSRQKRGLCYCVRQGWAALAEDAFKLAMGSKKMFWNSTLRAP